MGLARKLVKCAHGGFAALLLMLVPAIAAAAPDATPDIPRSKSSTGARSNPFDRLGRETPPPKPLPLETPEAPPPPPPVPPPPPPSPAAPSAPEAPASAPERDREPSRGPPSGRRQRPAYGAARPHAALSVESDGFPERRRTDLPLSAGVLAGGRWRTPDVLAFEVGASIALSSFAIGVLYQPGADWRLQGRPIRVTGLTVTAGWDPLIYRKGRFELDGRLSLELEHLNLERRDVAAATVHGVWDLGAAGGGSIAWRFVDSLEARLLAELVVLPTARTVHIPDGPSANLNLAGLRAAIVLVWTP